MPSYSKKYSVIVFILLILMGYDYMTTRPADPAKALDAIALTVHNTLASETKALLTPSLTTLLSKKELSVRELNQVKKVLDELEDKNLYVKLYKDSLLHFWTKEKKMEGFCRDFVASPYSGEICYAPFDNNGQVSLAQLEQNKLGHYFKINHTTPDNIIDKLPIQLGKKYRSSLKEYVIYSGYLILLLLIIVSSLRHQDIFPYLCLAGLRLLSIVLSWSDRFSLAHISDSFFKDMHYNSMDLMIDGLMVFAGLLHLTRVLLSTRTGKEISRVGLLGIAFLHMLLFISHIRVIQLIIGSELKSVSLEDLSLISRVDMILLVVLSLVLLGIFHFGYVLFKYHRKHFTSMKISYAGYGISIFIAVCISYALHLDLNYSILLLFLIAYFTLLDLFVDVKVRTITWVIWWAIFFAIYLSALLFNYDIKKEVSARQDFLEQAHHSIPSARLHTIANNNTINKIGEIITDLLVLPTGAAYDRDDFISFISDSLDQQHLLLDIFDDNGLSLFNKAKYEQTLYPHLLQIDSTTYFDELDNVIWMRYPLPQQQVGYIGFGAELTKASSPFSYNYYRNENTIRKEIDLSPKELKLLTYAKQQVIYQGQDVYVLYKPSRGRLLVSKKSFLGLVKPIALFSFLFSILAVLIIAIGLAHYILRILPEDWPLHIKNLESLNSKIQISLILVILLAFIIIASITSSFLQDYIASEKDLVITEKLENVTKDFQSRTLAAQSNNEAVEILANYKKNIEDIHNITLQIHPITGNSTDLDYFSKVFFSKQKNPFAFTYDTGQQDLSYLPIQHEGKLAGIAGLTLLHNHKTQVLNVFDFLGTIFNVYVFLFLIASVLSIFIAQSITRPLAMLNQKLSQLSLGKTNEQITWTKDDEIGVLIGNYNSMVGNLEESAEMLAKKERDSAWREMAKQVAHEIKNPLTPMKLSIQYLEKAIKQNPDNAVPIAKRITATMLEQINNLTGIAEAFGNFAQLPKSSNVKIELNNVVEVVHNLFRKREDMEITLQVPIDPLYVYADKSQLVRILNNLVKNAIEAIPNDRRGLIKMKLYTKNDKAIISVEDNGNGITDDMKGKIFQPKFTTKDSGSGLGLAISANMIDSMNGRIYFDSEPDVSTIFFIEMDIIRQTFYSDKPKRITLD